MSSRKSWLKTLTPGQTLILVYAAAILTGAVLLFLPLAAQGEPLSFLDALFTATSAQCVTGLIVVDTGTRLSLFGQLVVLALIQLGGLGITTFSVYLFFYLRLGVGLRGRWLIQETLLHTPVGSLRDLIREIFLMTLVIEGIGTFLISWVLIPRLGLWPGLYASLFHSVSAFCNAGFSLFPDSLTGFRSNPVINLTIMGLIVAGGIGFLVIRELLAFLPWHRGKAPRRLSLHTRIVLLTSAILIVVGALLIGLLEYDSAFTGMSFAEGFWTSLFQSITARTAGFNTIDLNLLRPSTLFLLTLLMFIGASPGSAGGGIKTTTLALFTAILHSRLRGNPHTNIFHRTIPDEAITKTLSLVMLALLLIGGAVFALLTIQLSGPATPGTLAGYMVYTFEAVSAFATVGLSMGATSQLLPAAKILIIVLMFVGRVGLLTVAFSIARRTSKDAVRYGQENIMIG
jgi:trk system potassium uptake protein TrkH